MWVGDGPLKSPIFGLLWEKKFGIRTFLGAECGLQNFDILRFGKSRFFGGITQIDTVGELNAQA